MALQWPITRKPVRFHDNQSVLVLNVAGSLGSCPLYLKLKRIFDPKRFVDRLGDKVDTGTACRVRLRFSYMTADVWLQITKVAVYALQGLLREKLYRMMSQLCEAVQIYTAR